MQTSATALAAIFLALTLAPGAASAQSIFGTPDAAPPRTSWTDAILGSTSSGPPWGVPVPTPRLGCYFTRARISNAWRRVEVCY